MDTTIIQHENAHNQLIYKHEAKTLDNRAELIVRAAQKVVLFKDAKHFNTYGPGRHLLSEELSTPQPRGILAFFKNLFKGKVDESTHEYCDIYFVNEMGNMTIHFKTEHPVVVEDPKLGLFLDVSCGGQFAVKVENINQYMTKFNGAMTAFDNNAFLKRFQRKITSIVNEKIVKTVQEEKIGFLELALHTEKIGKEVERALMPHLNEYGFSLSDFFIESLRVDPESYKKLVAMKQDSIMNETRVKDLRHQHEEMGRAKALIRREEGYTYQEERQFDILEGLTRRVEDKEDLFKQIIDEKTSEQFGNTLTQKIQTMSDESLDKDSTTKVSTKTDKRNTIICPECQTTNLKKTKLCVECGHALQPSPN